MPHTSRDTIGRRLATLNDRVQKASLRGAWQRAQRPREPDARPWVWRWKDMLPNVLEAGELVPIDETMRMRTLHVVNPSRPVPGATRTFAAMIQHLNPGETTESHRHTATSVYFMIQGSGTYTTAEGEQQFMEPGDLLVQPTWTWHGSSNTGSEPALWLTCMDTSLMHFLDAWFHETYPEGRVQPITRPDGYYMRRMGALRSTPVLEDAGPRPIRYRWEDTLETLEQLARAGEVDPYEGVVLDYTNPLDGSTTTTTLGCRIQLLGPGKETLSHRHTSNTIYHVVRGSGLTKIGGSRGDEDVLDWGERDCFYIPPWYWHRFHNESSTEPVILFSTSDRPLFEGIKLYRETMGGC